MIPSGQEKNNLHLPSGLIDFSFHLPHLNITDDMAASMKIRRQTGTKYASFLN